MTDILTILLGLREQAESDSLARIGGNDCSTIGSDEPDPRPAMAKRRSVRFFAPRSVAADVVTRVVAAAHRLDAALWPELVTPSPLTFYLTARHVDGLAPGIHRYDDGDWNAVADLPADSFAADAVLQPEFALAPALLIATGSLEAALTRDGAHGHRVLLERSGAACETAWLTAVEHGLAGSIFAGFLPSALESLVGIDGFRRTQLLALALGHATERVVSDPVAGPTG